MPGGTGSTLITNPSNAFGGSSQGAYQTLADHILGVPKPYGNTLVDTATINAAIAAVNALGADFELQFDAGTYVIDSNAIVIRNCAS